MFTAKNSKGVSDQIYSKYKIFLQYYAPANASRLSCTCLICSIILYDVKLFN